MLIRLLLRPAWKTALIGRAGGGEAGDAGGELAIAPEPPLQAQRDGKID